MLILSRGEKIFAKFNVIFMIIICLITIYPFWYVIIYSLNSASDSNMGGMFLFPREFTLANYKVVFFQGAVYQAFYISVLRVAVAVPLHLLVTSLSAYALSREKVLFRKTIIFIFFITMIFSGGLIPSYLLYNSLGLLNSFWVFVLPGLFGVWDFIVFKTMFKTTVPESLVEAALIDGAGHIQIYYKLIVPLCIPVFVALGIFGAVGHWNDWFAGLYFVQDVKLMPLQSYLRTLIVSQGNGSIQNVIIQSVSEFDIRKVSSFTVTMAAVVITVSPILVVYPFLQKYFISGVMVGAIKE